jgi:hypothetical protein
VQSTAQADYILSSIRQDAKFERKTTELKNLLIKKSVDTNNKIDLLNKTLQDQFNRIEEEILFLKNKAKEANSDRFRQNTQEAKNEERDYVPSQRHLSKESPPHLSINQIKDRRTQI